MKTQTFWTWSLGLALALLPLAGGCDQQTAMSAPATDTTATSTTAAPASSTTNLLTITNAPTPEAAVQDLENATGKVVSTPESSSVLAPIPEPAADVAKLAQAGVDESVMLAFVTNSSSIFNLTSDQIIYLNDIGVPGTVVTAMIQHDETMKSAWPQSASNTAAPAMNESPETAPPETAQAQPAPDVVENPAPAPQQNITYNYFYDSLAPYGNWIDVAGYGWCWQPTVVVVNPAWTPYCDNGYWMYTDCGWYWDSNYSWGWAPFHYGRWFRSSRWGWCWAPDTVWGPAWVSWRYAPGYCGWAPLPPTACFTPGFGFTYFGRSVGFSFGFGLSADCYTFVGLGHFADRDWHRYHVPRHNVRDVFRHTVVDNRIITRGRTVINAGIPVNRVASASHSQIRPVRIRDVSSAITARAARGERQFNNTLAVYRPNLPPPTHRTTLVGQDVRLDSRARRTSVRLWPT